MTINIRRQRLPKVSACLQTILLAWLCYFGVLSGHAQSIAAGPITVAAAADLQFALPEIVNAYTKATGIPVRVTYGSSGNLAAQIANGAPFDVLLSADVRYPQQLIADKNAAPESLTQYARGCLVVWFGASVRNLPAHAGIADVAAPEIRNLAIANPKHAPYGRAAEAALKSAGIYDRVASKLVLGENIAQTAQFVESGNAQAGLVALSLLQGSKNHHEGVWRMVPLDTYPPLDQAGVVTSHGAKNSAARKFLEFLHSEAVRKIFEAYGFRRPSKELAK